MAKVFESGLRVPLNGRKAKALFCRFPFGGRQVLVVGD